MAVLRTRLNSLGQGVGLSAKQRIVAVGYYTSPSFIGIGVQKGGTTALFQYLSLHPQIMQSSHKELHFFCEHYERGIHWFHSHFPAPFRMPAGKITYEFTPHYIYRPEVPQRIHQYNPHIKLIVSLRNPVTRAFSAWNMPHFQNKFGTASFDELVEREFQWIDDGKTDDMDSTKPDFIRRGVYYDQLMRYFALFPREQILIFEDVELRYKPTEILRRTTSFLNVSDHAWDNETFPPHHVGNYSTKMSPNIRERLVEFFHPHNEKLYELLGVDYNWK